MIIDFNFRNLICDNALNGVRLLRCNGNYREQN